MKILKWIGALVILSICMYAGLHSGFSINAEIRSLQKLICALDYMSCELQYKLTPLPDLCRQTAKEVNGKLQKLFDGFADEIENQIMPDIKSCMQTALSKVNGLPDTTEKQLIQLSASMGRFDLSGQIQALESVRTICRKQLEVLEIEKESKIRTKQTLWICSGAAMVILFV